MLNKLALQNYRCFEKTEIVFKDLSVVVGKNNAGKSTLIEALRILSLVVNRCKNSNYFRPPNWLAIDDEAMGIKPSLSSIEFSPHGIIFMYGDGPAKIISEFDNGVKITIYINSDGETYATIQNSIGVFVESKRFAGMLKLKAVNILPQISPLLRDEPTIKEDTVLRNLSTYLSSRNFRNQLHYFPKQFDRFKELSEKTWQGLQIDSKSTDIRTQGNLFLFVRDNRFEAEIGMMGHGLQMWLQTMWFLSRCEVSSTVILDEPDVYMHADLQRRLIKLLKSLFKQIIVATHSVEIMSEVEPENILPINNTRPKQEYANKTPLVQKIVNEIGSVHNIEIARLFSSTKFLIVEGEKEDVKLLSIFQAKVFPNSFEQFDILPKTFVEGWGGWQRVIGSNKVFKDNQTSIKTYCIFDSDYHLESEKKRRLNDAKENEINLHIWAKKEIENYLLVPSAICRLVKHKRKNSVITELSVAAYIREICSSLKDDVIDSFATEIKNQSGGTKEIKTINQEARLYVNERWEKGSSDLVSGKQILAKLFGWISENHKVSINKFALAREISLAEVDPEIIKVITCIENKTAF